MGDNSTGSLVIVAKNYTENGEKVRWNSAGETNLQSGKRIQLHGKQEGVSFHKNDPVVLNAGTTIKVLKVEGPKSVVNGNTYEFKATSFSEQVPDNQLRLVAWAFSFDGGKSITHFKTGTTRVDKEVSVYAFFRKPDTKVVTTTKIIYLPLVVDVYRTPGLNEDATDIANDMAFGKGVAKRPVYTKGEVDAYKNSFVNDGFDVKKDAKYANAASGGAYSAIYNEKQILDTGYLMQLSNAASNDDALFLDFRVMVETMARGDLNDNIKAMINKFQKNEGGVYENAKLTAAAQANPSTQRFCTGIEDEMAERIKKAGGELITMEDKKVYAGSEAGYKTSHPYGHPAFPYSRDYNLIKGLTIAVNDVWSYKVTLLSFKQTGDNYKARYEVQLWDHFGLDLPDMEKFYSWGAGFRAWFLLQHLRGYKPFLTKMAFTKEFSGNITEGAQERKKKR
jgi:hypothetical protein